MKPFAFFRVSLIGAALILLTFSVHQLKTNWTNARNTYTAISDASEEARTEKYSAPYLQPSSTNTHPLSTSVSASHSYVVTAPDPAVQRITPPSRSGVMSAASRQSNQNLIQGAPLFSSVFNEKADGSYSSSTTAETQFHYPLIRTDQRFVKDASGRDQLVETKQLVADHLVVVLNNKADEQLATQRLQTAGFEIRRPAGLSGAMLASFPVTHALALEDALQRAETVSDLATVEPDYIAKGVVQPNDEFYYLQRAFSKWDSEEYDLDAARAWNIATDASKIVVAVVDTGIDYDHPDLAENIWTNPNETENGIDDDGNGYVDDIYGVNLQDLEGTPMDDRFHGTHVAGTIGAVGDNVLGVAGVAWSVQLMACKGLNDQGLGSSYDLAECIAYAVEMGADVINASFTAESYSTPMFFALQNARNKNIVVTAAAGNEGIDIDDALRYPAAYDLDNIIAVGASTPYGEVAGFSNYGKQEVDIAAMGTSIFSTTPTVVTAAMEDRGLDADYDYLSGTSVAAPQVAGSVALLKAHFPKDNYRQTIDRLLNNGEPASSWSKFSATGNILNLYHALNSDQEETETVKLAICSATASNNDSNVPSNAIDGKLGTRWSGLGNKVTLELALCNTASLSNIKVAWFRGDQRQADFDIQVSEDGSSWNTVESGPSSGTTTNFENYRVNTGSVNFVKVIGYGNSINSWNSISEIEVYGTEAEENTAPQPEQPTPTSPTPSSAVSQNICTITASEEDRSNFASNAIDGSRVTRWSANNTDVTLEMTLCDPASITEIQIAWFKGDQRQAIFDIQTSDDGSDWTTVASGPSSGTRKDYETYSIDSVETTHVRIHGYGNSTDSWNSINEIKVIGAN